MAEVLPLGEEKYYGTRIQLRVDGDLHIIKVWCPNHFASPFGSEREQARGWCPIDDGHDHVEDQQSLEIAQTIAHVLTKKGM